MKEKLVDWSTRAIVCAMAVYCAHVFFGCLFGLY